MPTVLIVRNPKRPVNSYNMFNDLTSVPLKNLVRNNEYVELEFVSDVPQSVLDQVSRRIRQPEDNDVTEIGWKTLVSEINAIDEKTTPLQFKQILVKLVELFQNRLDWS